jgi:hypothetical protein
LSLRWVDPQHPILLKWLQSVKVDVMPEVPPPTWQPDPKENIFGPSQPLIATILRKIGGDLGLKHGRRADEIFGAMLPSM